MTVKKFYKVLQKAFPTSDIFVVVNGENYWLAIPSTAMRKYGKMQVINIESDYDTYNDIPTYFLKTGI